MDVLGRGFDRSTFQFDWRHYNEVLPQTILALRAQWRASFGGDTEFFYLGGPNDFRGVDWFSLRGERTRGPYEHRLQGIPGQGLRVRGPHVAAEHRGEARWQVAAADDVGAARTHSADSSVMAPMARKRS